MPKPLSIDLRERIVDAVLSGATLSATAARFEVSQSSVKRFIALYRRTGSVCGKPYGGKKKFVLTPYREILSEWVTQQPDITQLEIRERLLKQDVVVSKTAVRNMLLHMGLRYKKNAIRQRTGTR